jgi:hypothetical protein
MNTYIFILFIVLFPGLIAFTGMVLTQNKAKKQSAKITLREAWNLSFRGSATKQVFQALSIIQTNHLPISLRQIEAHWFASGDPVKVMRLLAENPSYEEATFQNLSVIDLAGLDAEKAIILGQKTHEVIIKGIQISSFQLDYHARFKLGLSSIFNDDESKSIEQRINEKLSHFSSSWESSDPIYTQNFLLTNILNIEYWDTVLNAKLINQNIELKA